MLRIEKLKVLQEALGSSGLTLHIAPGEIVFVNQMERENDDN